jgi:hypothetical protein
MTPTVIEILIERLRAGPRGRHDPEIHGIMLAAAAEIERLQGLLDDACVVFDHYELPEHALHYRRALAREASE